MKEYLLWIDYGYYEGWSIDEEFDALDEALAYMKENHTQYRDREFALTKLIDVDIKVDIKIETGGK